ncbi:MAG: hypothetical protein WC584_02110 [Candidatus Pacearchaeota archaeon]
MKEKENEEINEEIKKLVIARIDAQVSSNLRLSIGSHGSLSKEEMIERVKKGDEIGKKIIKSHLTFMRSLANGEITKALVSIE